MSISWTKSWSSSDDGSILSGSDLQNIQSDISGAAVTLSGTQTITGDKTYSGQLVTTYIDIGSVDEIEISYLNGVASALAGANEMLCYDNSVVCYENNVVYYR